MRNLPILRFLDEEHIPEVSGVSDSGVRVIGIRVTSKDGAQPAELLVTTDGVLFLIQWQIPRLNVVSSASGEIRRGEKLCYREFRQARETVRRNNVSRKGSTRHGIDDFRGEFAGQLIRGWNGQRAFDP